MLPQLLVFLLASGLVGSVQDSVLYRTWHRGRKCSSAVTVYELEPRYLLDVCLALETDLGRLDTHVQFSCITGSNKFTLLQKNYDLLDSSCSEGALSSTVVEHDYACRHDAASGFWIKSQCGPLPSSLSAPAQLEVLPYTDGSCTLTPEALVGSASSRRLLLGTCQAVYNTAGVARAGRKRQQDTGDVLYHRRVFYQSGPIGTTGAWDAGAKLIFSGGRRLSAEMAMSDTGKVNDTAAGWSSHRRALLVAAVDPIVLLVERYNFEDKTCEGPVKFSWTVKYTVQTTAEEDSQCVPDPLFAGFYYHVATAAVPTRFPTASPTNPTPEPSSRPTRLPTAKPSTSLPTSLPTPGPTQPSPLPTTPGPTQPSTLPTTTPTPLPSPRPSAIPTAPSASPTLIPTRAPTALPTSASSTADGYGLTYYWLGKGTDSDSDPDAYTYTGIDCNFDGPTGKTITPDETYMYVTSYWRHVILRVTMATLACTVVAGNTISPVSSSGTCQYTSALATAVGTNARFCNPTGIAVSPDGRYLYVSDFSTGTSNCRIRKIDRTTGPYTVTTLSGSGVQGSAAGAATSATFNNPITVVIDKAGEYLWIGEHEEGGYVRRVSTSTGYADVVFRYSSTSIMKFGSLVLQEPYGTTKKYLIIADQGKNAIYRVDVSSYVSGGATLGTSAVTMILPRTGSCSDSSCTCNAGCSDSYTEQTTSAAGAAGYAFSVALSKDQNTLYFSSAYTGGWPPDRKGNMIRSVALDGTNYITKTVSGSTDYPSTNSPITTGNAAYGTSAEFRVPIDVLYYKGSLYISEGYADAVRRIVLPVLAGAAYFTGDGQETSSATLVVSGPPSSSATLSSGSSCNIKGPSSMTQSLDGSAIYVSSATHNIVVKLTFQGVTTPVGYCQTIAGTLNSAGLTEGTGTSAKFSFSLAGAGGLVVDQSTGSTLYIADYGKIRKMDMSTSVVSTFAGSALTASPVRGSDDGVGTSATFYNPNHLAMSSDGTVLYVSDTGDGTTCYIRKIVVSSVTVSTPYSAACTTFSPAGMAVSSGNTVLYVASNTRHAIIALGVSTTTPWTKTVIAGTEGTLGYRESTAPGTSYSSLLNAPEGLFLDVGNNFLYFSEKTGNRIRRIDLDTTGYYQTMLVAGSTTVASSVSTKNTAQTGGAISSTTSWEIRLNAPSSLLVSIANPNYFFIAESASTDVRVAQFSLGSSEAPTFNPTAAPTP